MTNHEKLDAAGMLNPDFEFSEEDKKVLESLSDEEVEALISAQKKVNAAKDDGQDIAFGILH